MLGLGIDLGLGPRRGGGGAPVAGAARVANWSAAVGLTPTLYYHPNTETVTVSGGRLTAASPFAVMMPLS